MFPFLLITLPNNVNLVIQFWTSCFQSAFIFISLPRVPNGRFREVFLHHWRLFSFAWILVRFRASASNSLDSSTAQCYPYHVLSQKSSVYFFESNRKSWQQFFWNFRALDRMFTIDDDLLPIFPFAEFLFLIVRRLAGLKWVFFVVTAFCSCRKTFQKAALQLKPGISLSFKIDESLIKRNILRHNVNKLPRKQVITAAKLVSQKV